jgi:sphingomyelin phosphodiesterase acid-like 3
MLLRKSAAFETVRPKPERLQSLWLAAVLAALIFSVPLISFAEAASNNQFLIASDIHFDPMADPTLVAELAAAEPAQWEVILQRSKPTRFSQYGQDTNWWLLQSALDQMRKTMPRPAFVMCTGDLLAHGFPKAFRNATHDDDLEHYRAFVLKTVQFLALEFGKRFPNTTILVTPGNNDEECGDYSIRAGGTFLSDTASLAQRLAQASGTFTDEWKALGSYNIPHPALPGLRILSLNTVFFSNNYHATSFRDGCAKVSSNAAADALAWLASNLAAAKQAHERVWLMFHIPPGIDGYMSAQKRISQSEATSPSADTSCANTIVPMWVPEWTARFDALLETFQDTVIASFSGHTHTDDFRLISSAGVNRAFVLVDPPVSPIYGQNPGFRVVTFASDGSLADQTTYYLTNLKTASSTVRGRWKREYRFSKEWKVRRLDLANLGKIYDEIQSTPSSRAQWLKLYNVSSAGAVVSPDSVRGLYCAIGALDPSAYERCYCRMAAGQDVSAGKP